MSQLMHTPRSGTRATWRAAVTSIASFVLGAPCFSRSGFSLYGPTRMEHGQSQLNNAMRRAPLNATPKQIFTAVPNHAAIYGMTPEPSAS